jgi:hypothetical protein
VCFSGKNSSGDKPSIESSEENLRQSLAAGSGFEGLNDAEWKALQQIAQLGQQESLGGVELTSSLVEGLLRIRHSKWFATRGIPVEMCNEIAQTIHADPLGRTRMLEFQQHLLRAKA